MVIFLAYNFVSRVNRPHLYTKTTFWEHLKLKSMDGVFTYIFATDKAIITKLVRISSKLNITFIFVHVSFKIHSQRPLWTFSGRDWCLSRRRYLSDPSSLRERATDEQRLGSFFDTISVAKLSTLRSLPNCRSGLCWPVFWFVKLRYAATQV